MNTSKLRRRALTGLVIGLAIGSGTLAMAAWTADGSGTGYSKAGTATAITLSDASSFTTADLYPGATGTSTLRVTNPNSFPVTITAVTKTGAITSDSGSACDASTGVTYTNQTGLSQTVSAGATTTVSLANSVAMSDTSDNSCQGATFAFPVSVTATS